MSKRIRCVVQCNNRSGEPRILDDLFFKETPRAGDSILAPTTNEWFTVLRIAHYPGRSESSATLNIVVESMSAE